MVEPFTIAPKKVPMELLGGTATAAGAKKEAASAVVLSVLSSKPDLPAPARTAPVAELLDQE